MEFCNGDRARKTRIIIIIIQTFVRRTLSASELNLKSVPYLNVKKCDGVSVRFDTVPAFHGRTAQAVRVATQYAPPLSFPRGRPSASRAAEETQRSSTFPRPIRSHAQYVPMLPAAAALRVKAALSKAVW